MINSFPIYYKHWNESVISVIKLHHKKILLIAGIAFGSLAIAYSLFLYRKIKLIEEMSDPEEQWNLTRYYGLEVDDSKAFHWYKKAAEAGLLKAQNSLAYCYHKGIGVEVDNSKAFHWYKKAAEAGDDKAQYNCAICFDQGIGVEKSQEETLKYCEQAAKAGFVDAQVALGIFYSRIGNFYDLKEAYKWYNLAANQGSTKAKNWLVQTNLG